jgi:phage tail protein X
MKTYTTRQGDTFDSIAFNNLGDRRYTKELMELNTNYLDIVIFSGNIVLNLPEIETPDTTAMNQPPWRSD